MLTVEQRTAIRNAVHAHLIIAIRNTGSDALAEALADNSIACDDAGYPSTEAVEYAEWLVSQRASVIIERDDA